MKEPDNFENEYSEKSFWNKLAQYAKIAGKEIVEKALCLFYAAKKPDTPIWAKAIIYSTLGYFILPMDAIPDIIPVVGYADDLGAFVVALGTVAAYIDKNVKQQAREKMKDWFDDQSTPFEQAAKDVLRELKALQSVVTGVVTYQDYGRRFSDVKIKVDAFTDKYRESPVPAFNEHVSDAIGYYNAASTAWSRGITQGGEAISGMSPLWECASDAIAQAEKAIGKMKDWFDDPDEGDEGTAGVPAAISRKT